MADTEEQVEICGKCGQAKVGSGRLTQWIKVCSCYAVPESGLDTEVKLCSVCGKRINVGRAGSFTQWVFRADSCSCPRLHLSSGDDTRSGDRKNSESDSNDAIESEQELERQQLAELYADRIPAERYQVIREIGKGAAGTVVLCRDLFLKKKVAIKSLNFLGRESLLNFQQEAKATSKLNHPNIVQVIDFGTTSSGAPFMVLEYFPGVSLEDCLKQYGAMPPDLALEVFKRVLDALIYSHTQRIWHRDVKPSNILLADIDADTIEVRLIDFGIAAITQSTGDNTNDNSPPEQQHKTLAGTPAYMSPDQALGRSYDARSEIYSLGCVLFEMLTGRPPFLGHTALETISLHGSAVPPTLADTISNADPFPNAVLAGLEKVIKTCLAKDPKDRYQSVAQLKQALTQFSTESTERHESLLKGLDLEVQADTTSGAKPKRESSGLLMIAMAAICILPLIFFLPFLLKDDSNNALPKIDLMSNTADDMGEGREADLTLKVGKHMWHAYMDTNSTRVLKNVKKRRNVENLWLSTVVDDPLITYVSKMPLEGLAFDDSPFLDMDSGLDKVTKMDSLNLLVFLQSSLTDHGLEQIATMPKLKYLAVESNFITDRGIGRLKAIPSLLGVSLSGMKQVTDKTVDVILQLPKLIAVSVGDTSITTDGAIKLIRTGRFIGLSIGGVPLTEPVLNALRDSNVERLSLIRSKIDRKVLDNIAVMKHLRTCDLRCSSTVNQEDVERMYSIRRKAGLPRILVLFGDDRTARDWDVMVDN